MPTIVTHAIAAGAMGSVFQLAGPKGPVRLPRGFWLLTVLCSMLPDADVITYDMGLAYGHMLGHRGLSHSLIVAAATGGIVALALGRGAWRSARWQMFVYFTLVTASHGLLDALVDEGLGVAFFAPFSGERYFFPWRPLEVSPIGGHGFFTTADMKGGLRWIEVLRSEIQWVWLPALLSSLLAGWLRWKMHIQSNPSADV
jgi:inner membrane protein